MMAYPINDRTIFSFFIWFLVVGISKMHIIIAVTLFILACVPFSHSLSLLDALKENANASIFAQYIQNNPSIAALYQSSYIKTVFAPSDEALKAANIDHHRHLEARQQPNYVADAAEPYIQVTAIAVDVQTLRMPPGCVFATVDTQSNLKDNNTSLVAGPQSNNGAKTTKRGLSSYDNSTLEPVKIFSGLGNTIKIVKEDTPYEYGLIQTTDG